MNSFEALLNDYAKRLDDMIQHQAAFTGEAQRWRVFGLQEALSEFNAHVDMWKAIEAAKDAAAFEDDT